MAEQRIEQFQLHIYAGDQTELVVQVECVEAESTGGALHKVNGTECHDQS